MSGPKFIQWTMIFCLLLSQSLFAIRLDSVYRVRREAMSAYNEKKLDSAIVLYHRVIAMGDSSVFPYYNLACCYGLQQNVDSSRWAMQVALDKGYMNYVEMTVDYDLQVLKSQPFWQQMCQQAFQNSLGKIPKMVFRDHIGDLLLSQDSQNLLNYMELPFRTSLQLACLDSVLKILHKSVEFLDIKNKVQLMSHSQLGNRKMTYENNRYVCRERYDFHFPISVVDADVANLLMETSVHLYTRTIDDAYMYLDSITADDWEKNIEANKIFEQLTDTVVLLALKTEGQKAFHYEEKVSKMVGNELNEALMRGRVVASSEFSKPQTHDSSLYYIRLTSLPVVKSPYKGVKFLFYADSPVGCLVFNDYYCFIRCNNLKKLKKTIEKLVKE